MPFLFACAKWQVLVQNNIKNKNEYNIDILNLSFIGCNLWNSQALTECITTIPFHCHLIFANKYRHLFKGPFNVSFYKLIGSPSCIRTIFRVIFHFLTHPCQNSRMSTPLYTYSYTDFSKKSRLRLLYFFVYFFWVK